MNSFSLLHRRPASAPADPVRYATRRLASLPVVGAAVAGIVAASVLDGLGAPISIALASGIVLFVGAAAYVTGAVARDPGAASGSATSYLVARILTVLGAHGSADASQLGPDPEQVIGRATGARV